MRFALQPTFLIKNPTRLGIAVAACLIFASKLTKRSFFRKI
ncbi:hypothetical protein HFN_1566 [Helicobacter fennelliae MRY12-0050]|uniref:Uncharacterized protein n=1 Tax=Helicobacter fennelliae MRY12-0050 TaxID=1325130 RepID=T1DUX0_9HELI|nr:hypothetical protein HFN_1566 [Helicobacter fennelliae MRY12-0050]